MPIARQPTQLDRRLFSVLAPLVAAIALALLDHCLGLRSPIGCQRAADLDLFGRELALVAANVALVTL